VRSFDTRSVSTTSVTRTSAPSTPNISPTPSVLHTDGQVRMHSSASGHVARIGTGGSKAPWDLVGRSGTAFSEGDGPYQSPLLDSRTVPF
jgi:hypothetical protein